MQINVNDMTIDYEFEKASRYLPVRLSTTFFDGIGECICVVANRADGRFTDIVEDLKSEVFIALFNPLLYDEIKNCVLNMNYWEPNTHYNTVNGIADGVQRKIHLEGMVF